MAHSKNVSETVVLRRKVAFNFLVERFDCLTYFASSVACIIKIGRA